MRVEEYQWRCQGRMCRFKATDTRSQTDTKNKYEWSNGQACSERHGDWKGSKKMPGELSLGVRPSPPDQSRDHVLGP